MTAYVTVKSNRVYKYETYFSFQGLVIDVIKKKDWGWGVPLQI